MPHDRNGKLLAAGDEVVIRGRVKVVTESEHYCNCTIELAEPMPTGDATPPRAGDCISAINTRQVEKVEPAPA